MPRKRRGGALCIGVALAAVAIGCGDVTLPTGSSTVLVDAPNNESPVSDPPATEYCAAVDDWASASAAFEDEVLSLINARRAAGADCGSAGSFSPAAPLTLHTLLRCAARNHSLDMNTRGFFDHFNPDGDGPAERMSQTGYIGTFWGENIAWGQTTPAQVVQDWMDSDGHCGNIMRNGFSETGIGHNGSLWTQVFGTP